MQIFTCRISRSASTSDSETKNLQFHHRNSFTHTYLFQLQRDQSFTLTPFLSFRILDSDSRANGMRRPYKELARKEMNEWAWTCVTNFCNSPYHWLRIYKYLLSSAFPLWLFLLVLKVTRTNSLGFLHKYLTEKKKKVVAHTRNDVVEREMRHRTQ